MAVMVRLTSRGVVVAASWLVQTTTISPAGVSWMAKAPRTICVLNLRSCIAFSGVLGPQREAGAGDWGLGVGEEVGANWLGFTRAPLCMACWIMPGIIMP